MRTWDLRGAIAASDATYVALAEHAEAPFAASGMGAQPGAFRPARVKEPVCLPRPCRHCPSSMLT